VVLLRALELPSQSWVREEEGRGVSREFIHVGGGIVVGELQRLHVTPLWKTHILSLQIGNETRFFSLLLL